MVQLYMMQSNMVWLIGFMCLDLGWGIGLGEDCDLNSRKFGERVVVIGENEVGDEEAIALDRTRRSFYRLIVI